jgi:hypothetical protein
LTVGTDHPRLPGLGLALVGLAPGEVRAVVVPPELGFGPADPARVRRLARRRFAPGAALQPGKLTHATDGRGRRRLVRVLQLSSETVLVDTNHPWAGQTLHLQVELLAHLLVVGPRADVSETLALVRFLSFCTTYSNDWCEEGSGALAAENPGLQPARPRNAPLLLLVASGEEVLVRAALEAGAHGCLTLPLHAKEVAGMVGNARAGNQPGRHTLSRERVQTADPRRDDGGEG